MAPLTVYILYSFKRKLFYIGITRNIENRLIQHNKGESGFTKSGIPWYLVWSRVFHDIKEAESLERKLKNLARFRKIRFIRKYSNRIVDHKLLDSIELDTK